MEAARAALSEADRAAFSARIAERLFDTPEWRDAGRIHAYVGIGPEVATIPILERAWAEGKAVACPKVEWRPPGLLSFAVASPDDLVPGPRGLREPDPARTEPAESGWDLILVPGLAYDRRGGRVGYGAGFYDRFLAGEAGAKAGLAFSLQILDAVPFEPHDVRVDRIVTERELVEADGGCADPCDSL